MLSWSICIIFCLRTFTRKDVSIREKKTRVQVIRCGRTVCPSCEKIVKLWVVVYKALKLRLFYLIYSMVGLYFALRTYKVLSVIRWKYLTGCLYPSSQNVDTQSDPQCYINIMSLLKKDLKKKKTKKSMLIINWKRRHEDRKVEYKMFRNLSHIEVNIFVLALFFFACVILLSCLIPDSPEISIIWEPIPKRWKLS